MAGRHASVRSVGILTMPQNMKGSTTPYIINNNVKWFADRGVDIIPIPYNTKSPEKYMSRIHGLYLQGGPVYNTSYMKTAARLLELALKANKDGEYFPVWGTCHGFQTLIMVFGGLPLNGSELEYFDARSNYISNVKLTKMGAHARVAHEWSDWFKEYLQKGDHIYFANEHGISPESFLANDSLRKIFSLVAISHDRKGKRFASIIEAKKGLPFYGTQFHSEAVPTLEPFRSFFIEELLKNSKVKRRQYSKTFRQRYRVRNCTRYKGYLNHNRFQDSECYFF